MDKSNTRNTLEPRWYIFYTRSRSEKKVFELLTKKNIEAYLPLIKTTSQWSDRKKKIEIPLFRSYIFIRLPEFKISEVIQWTPGLVSTIKESGLNSYLKQEEIDRIKKLISTGAEIETGSNVSFFAGDKIIISSGPLKGLEGEVVQIENKNYFILRITQLNQCIKVQLSKNIIEKK
jgi:transcription antitermination factor NusG